MMDVTPEEAERLQKAAQSTEPVTQAEMPKYQCHKKVWALKISSIEDPTIPGNESDGSRIIIPADDGFAAFKVDREYVHKHKPEVGGYYVVYSDGYKSFSPAKAFEEGYSKIEPYSDPIPMEPNCCGPSKARPSEPVTRQGQRGDAR